MSDLVCEIRLSIRSLGRRPAYVVTSVTTLALGIAAVTCLFAFYNAVYLRPLSYASGDRLIAIGEEHGSSYGRFSDVSSSALSLVLQENRAFDRVSAYEPGFATIATDFQARPTEVLAIDTGFVPLFQLHPVLGRLITREEIEADQHVALISAELWQHQFRREESVLRETINIGAELYRIVGVLPLGFRFPMRTDVFIPLPSATRIVADRTYGVVARLGVGMTRQMGAAELRLLSSRLERPSRLAPLPRLVLRSEPVDRASRNFMPNPTYFLVASLLVFGAAAVNVLRLTLARAQEKAGEMAVRAAMGATPGTLVRHRLLESTILAVAATIIGALLSIWCVRIVIVLLPGELPSWIVPSLDARTLGAAAILAVAAILGIGLLPAWRDRRLAVAPQRTLSGTVASWSGHSHRRSQRSLVIQCALAFLFMAIGGLLWRSYLTYHRVDWGFQAQEVVSIQALFQGQPSSAQWETRAMERALERIRQVHGIEAAIRGQFASLRSPADTLSRVEVRSGAATRVMRPDASTPQGDFRPRLLGVSEAFFRVAGIHVLRGRSFNAADDSTHEPVAIISESFAESMWPGQSPLYHRFRVGPRGPEFTVIGMVADVRDLQPSRSGFKVARSQDAYLSIGQTQTAQPAIVVKSRHAADAASAVLAAVHETNPSAILLPLTTMADRYREVVLVTRVLGGMIGSFALLTLVIAMVGFYGAAMYDLERSRRNIAICMAIGCSPTAAAWLVLRGGLQSLTQGLMLGVLLALGATQLLRALLVETAPTDPATFALVLFAFVLATALAVLVPAVKASRVSPASALGDR